MYQFFFLGKGQKWWFVKLSKPFDKVLVWKFKLRPEKKILKLFNKFWPIADGRGLKDQCWHCQFWSAATFCAKIFKNYFVFQIPLRIFLVHTLQPNYTTTYATHQPTLQCTTSCNKPRVSQPSSTSSRYHAQTCVGNHIVSSIPTTWTSPGGRWT